MLISKPGMMFPFDGAEVNHANSVIAVGMYVGLVVELIFVVDYDCPLQSGLFAFQCIEVWIQFR